MPTVSHRIRSLTLVASAATAMLLMMVLPASAQYPPGPPPGLSCPPSPTPGGVTPPGLVRRCELIGTLPSQAFRVSYEYNPVVEVGEVVTGEDRTVVFDLEVERGAVGRVVTVNAVAEDGTELITLEDSFRVAGAAQPPVDRGEPVTPGRPLARTGVDALALGGIGVLLLGAGIVAVRRRDGGRRVSEGSGTHAGT
jgi:hypothetical protein